MKVLQQGDRVQPSDHGLSANIFRAKNRHSAWRGTIVGFSRDGQCYRVRPDHQSTVESLHMSFLRKADTE